jgi:hypothetical protein
MVEERVTTPTKRKSRLSTGPFSLSLDLRFDLAIGLLATLGILTLTTGILLLLAGLPAAALLLAGFLIRVLVLLARILVWVGHRDLPCWT